MNSTFVLDVHERPLPEVRNLVAEVCFKRHSLLDFSPGGLAPPASAPRNEGLNPFPICQRMRLPKLLRSLPPHNLLTYNINYNRNSYLKIAFH